MPERLNFGILLKITDDVAIRRELLLRFRQALSRRLGNITEASSLDYVDPKPETPNMDIEDALDYPLGSSELLLFYFASLQSKREAVLSISKHPPNMSVYTFSLPDTDLADRQMEMSDVLFGLLSGPMHLNLQSAVAAGKEVGIESSVGSISDLINAASDVSSLVDYLCLRKVDSNVPAGFSLIAEKDDMVIFRRHRHA